MTLAGCGFSFALFILTKKSDTSSFFFNEPGENMNDCSGTLQLVPGGDGSSKARRQSREPQVTAACGRWADAVVPTRRVSPLRGRGQDPQPDGDEMGPVPHGGSSLQLLAGSLSSPARRERERSPHLPEHLDSPRRTLLQLSSSSRTEGGEQTPKGHKARDPFPRAHAASSPATLTLLLSALSPFSPPISVSTMTSPPCHLYTRPLPFFSLDTKADQTFFNYRSVCWWCLQASPRSHAGSDVVACRLSAWVHLFITRSLAFLHCWRSEPLTWQRRLEVTAVKAPASEIIAACWLGWESWRGQGESTAIVLG